MRLSRNARSALTLPLCLVLSACPLEDLVVCDEAVAERVETERVVFTLVLDRDEADDSLPGRVTFEVADGLAARVVSPDSDYPKGLTFTPAMFWNGSTDEENVARWNAWFQQVEAYADDCAAGAACDDPAADPLRVAKGVLEARTPEGLALAAWSLEDVWPTALLSVGGDADCCWGGLRRPSMQRVALLQLGLSARVTGFALGETKELQEMCAESGACSCEEGLCTQHALPEPPVPGVSPDAWNEGVARFAATYLDLGNIEGRLNALRATAPKAEAGSAASASSSGTGRNPQTGKEIKLAAVYAQVPTDPFTLEQDGVVLAEFAMVTGLAKEVEVVEYRDGDSPTARHRPGRTKVGRVTLSRAMAPNDGILDWHRSLLAGTFERRDVSIVQRTEAGDELVRFELPESLPVGWGTSPHAAGGIEKIEIAVEKVEREMK